MCLALMICVTHTRRRLEDGPRRREGLSPEDECREGRGNVHQHGASSLQDGRVGRGVFVLSSAHDHARCALPHVALLQVSTGRGCSGITVMTAAHILLLTRPAQCLVKRRHQVKPCI